MRITIDLVANTATFNTDIQRSTRNLEREMRRAEAEARRRADGIRAAITSITAAFVAPVAGAIFGQQQASKQFFSHQETLRG